MRAHFATGTPKKDLTAYLFPSYTVYEYDRRGRGQSGPADDATVEREIEDLATIAALTGEAPFVFGDSSGGALVIAAAAAGTPFRSRCSRIQSASAEQTSQNPKIRTCPGLDEPYGFCVTDLNAHVRQFVDVCRGDFHG